MENKNNKNNIYESQTPKNTNHKNNNRKVSFSYEALWKSIIRPKRDEYSEDDLGLNSIIIHKKHFSRKDYNILGTTGNILKCTFYELDEIDRKTLSIPVIIYLHGNCGSRTDSLRYIRKILENEINLFCFDFAGCGKSEGEYISLGFHESEDLKIIIDFIKKLPHVGKIGLWGHSMGAATAILYAASDNRINCCCIDSAFSDFSILARELSEKVIHVPNFIYSTAISFVKKTVIKKNGLDIDNLKPIDKVENINVPIFFIHGNKDEIIDYKHTIDLFEKCKSEQKYVNFFEGGHNTRRSKELVEKIMKFFKENLYSK